MLFWLPIIPKKFVWWLNAYWVIVLLWMLFLFVFSFFDCHPQSGECKGFAFVEFVTLEHAQYFMMTFGKYWLTFCCVVFWLRFFVAGSHGDRHAPQFIVENRAVLLEYAREKPPSTYEPKHGGASGGEYKKSAPRSDWMCTNVRTITSCIWVILGLVDSVHAIILPRETLVSSVSPPELIPLFLCRQTIMHNLWVFFISAYLVWCFTGLLL